MRLVGLTGGIACGKSTCTTLLSQAGLPIIDCDALARAAVRKGTWGYRRVLSAFGSSLLAPDGEIDREALGELVFGNKAARDQLNKATHLPVLLGILQQLLRYWLTCMPVVVIDMPLLMETGFYHVTRPRVLIACNPAVQRERLMQRDQLGLAAAEARIASQMPLERKRQLADVVLENNGTLQEFEASVWELAAALRRGTWIHRFVVSPIGLAAAASAVAWVALGR